jgi:hypothetical protein
MEGGKHPEKRKEFLTHPAQRTKESLLAAIQKAREAYEIGKTLHQDPEVRTGSEAAFRSALNIAISCVDVVPGAGEVASWGADLLKIIEEIQYRQKKREVEKAGGDVSQIQRKKYNLTPDVHLLLATSTEALEALSFFTFPTHAFETLNQLWYDIPRMIKGARRARALLEEVRQKHARAREAAERFAARQHFEEYMWGNGDKKE